MCKCKYCGKEFETKQKLGGHVNFCKLNPKYEQNLKNLNEARKHIDYFNDKHELFICQFCGKEINNKGCLVIHEKACEKNPNREKCKNRVGNGGHKNGHYCKWKGKTKLNDEVLQKRSELFKQRYKNGEYKSFSHKHSEKTKQKLREIFEEKVQNQLGKFKCFYSKRGCEYIENLNKEKHWNLQHAENGGEINCLGYWLDGYDKELNIVFEYDEERHYKDVLNNILTDKDLQRQQNIINELHCEFWRYNEYLNLLYKVN